MTAPTTTTQANSRPNSARSLTSQVDKLAKKVKGEQA